MFLTTTHGVISYHIIKLIVMGHYVYAGKKWETYFDMT